MTKLPIRSWQERALVAAMLAASVPSQHEALQGDAFFLSANEALLSPDAVDKALLDYRWKRRKLSELEALLFTLRKITPGPDAWLEFPPAFDLRAGLDETARDVATLIAEPLLPHVEQPPATQMVDALVLAVFMRESLGGGA